MCKILTLSNSSKLSVTELKTFLEVSFPIVTAHDNHGFGWACLGKSGVFGERYVSPKSYTGDMFNKVKVPLKMLDALNVNSEGFGTITKPEGPLLVHGRFSTNEINMRNTHPFQRNDWNLIHNGVVDNIGEKYTMKSTCDTEHLIQYISTVGVQDMVKNVSGYYAIAAIDPTGALHIIKDSTAQLYCSFVSKIDSFVFATTEKIITEVCDEMKWKHSPIYAVKDNRHLVLIGNEIAFQSSISPMKASWDKSDKRAAKAFGWDKYDDYRDEWASEGDWDKSSTKIISVVDLYDVDDKYEVMDNNGVRMEVADYMELTDADQDACTIVELGSGNFIENKSFNSIVNKLRKAS